MILTVRSRLSVKRLIFEETYTVYQCTYGTVQGNKIQKLETTQTNRKIRFTIVQYTQGTYMSTVIARMLYLDD